MITKLRIDNFRCFTNFRLDLDTTQLFLGVNGGGKTSVFDVLEKLRSLLQGQKATDLFSPLDLTGWDKRSVQDFAVELREGDDRFRYELQIEHDRQQGKLRISREQLTWNDSEFYRFENGEAHLYRQDKTGEVVEGTSFSFDWTQSFVPLIPERSDNKPLIRFRKAIGRWIFIGIAPMLMETFSEKESSFVSRNASNFSSWYRSLSTDNPPIVAALGESIREAIPHLAQLEFLTVGEAKALRARFNGMDNPVFLYQLSDGQRVLIVLHTMLAAMRSLGIDLLDGMTNGNV